MKSGRYALIAVRKLTSLQLIKEVNAMNSNPWIKVILVSLGGIVIGIALLWSLQQFNSYNYYNTYRMQGGIYMPALQQGMNMQMDNSGHMAGMN